MSAEDIIFNLKINVEETEQSFRKLEQIILRSLVLTRRMGLPENVNSAIMQIQRMIVLTQQLNTALQALSLASASNPIGAAFAVTGLAITAFSYADALTYDSRG